MDNISSTYYLNRNVSPSYYDDYKLPSYLRKVLPADKDARILDIGCGFGQIMKSLAELNYRNVKGVDISDEALANCRKEGLDFELISDIGSYCKGSNQNYDFIIMSHVLEHLDKNTIIDVLALIRKHLMATSASLMIMAPNAQSNTGCYWAYEDFTHHTLFTAGSIYYVLKSAGFTRIEFLDQQAVDGTNIVVRYIKRALLFCYIKKLDFWNWVTGSSYHRPSPRIFSYELKVLAK